VQFTLSELRLQVTDLSFFVCAEDLVAGCYALEVIGDDAHGGDGDNSD